jgi:HEPN/Toprim N-terminal domain 1
MLDTTEISQLRGGVDEELLAAFQDEMLRVRVVPAVECYGVEDVDEDEDDITVYEYRAPASVVRSRLDALGVNASAVCSVLNDDFTSVFHGPEFLDALDDELRAAVHQSDEALRALDANAWIDQTRAALSNPVEDDDPLTVGGLKWLLSQVDSWEPSYALCAFMLVLPDASEVVLEIFDLDGAGWGF